MPPGAATGSNDLVFTSSCNGVLLALSRNTGRRNTGVIVSRATLRARANALSALGGNFVTMPALRDAGKISSGHH
jgi:hypothetical protein